MSSEQWIASHPLVRLIRGSATDFDFFQLLHLIERVEQAAPPLGRSGPAPEETVRLRPGLRLDFPPGDIESADWRDNPLNAGGQLVITTTFLGLYGSDSPLPAHFTEDLLSEQDDDVRVRGFLDLIHHRLLSLLYRVWKKYRYYVTFHGDGADPISQVVRGFLGIGTPHLDQELGLHPVRMFRYVGLLSQRPRSAAGLVGQLRDFFAGVSFDIEMCVGRWLWIQQSDRNRLGSAKCALGRDFLLGERIYDRSGKFRIEIGPVGFEQYTRFLPNGEATRQLAEIVRFYCQDPFEFDVQVTLRGREVPETPLGDEGLLGRLAWTSWLKSQPCDNKSVIFSVPQRARASGAGG